MAFDKSPSTWLGAGYTLGTNAVSLKTANAGSDVALPNLTDEEADPSTGDIRKVMEAFCSAFYEAWVATSEEDRPQMMQLFKNAQAIPDSNQVQIQFGFIFTVDAAIEVADEPEEE